MMEKERECGYIMFMSRTWLPLLSTTSGEQGVSKVLGKLQ